MSPPSSQFSLDHLLTHAQFVRHLARDLVRDETRRDDVVQATWLAAIERPPERPERVRSWLRTVCRNFALRSLREDTRRQRRERVAARPDAVPAAADTVDRGTALRSVVEAVLELKEPYRTAVLLRFYEDLPPREIAKRLQLPVTTVQSRIQRGLEKLRQRLDQDFGNRRTWSLGVMALAGIPPVRGGAVATGAALGGWWSWWAALRVPILLGAVAVVVVIGWRTFAAEEAGAGDGGPAGPERTAADSFAEIVGEDQAAAVTTDPWQEPPEDAASAVPEHPDEDTVWVVGRAVDTARHGLARVTVTAHRAEHPPVVATTDGDGRFRLDLGPAPTGCAQEVGLHLRGPDGAAVRAVRVTPRGPRRQDTGSVALEPAGGIRVLVRDQGEPVPDALVLIQANDHVSRRFEDVPVNDVQLGRYRTGPEGLLDVDGLPPGEYVVRAARGRRRGTLAGVHRAGVDEAPWVIELRERRIIEVRVVDARTGEPLEGLELEAREVHRLGPTEAFTRDDLVGAIPPTNERGRTVIVGASMDEVLLLQDRSHRLAPPGLPAKTHRVEAGEVRVRVELPGGRRLSWPVSARGVPMPPEGAPVAVDLYQGRGFRGARLHGVIEAGDLVLDDVPLGCGGALAFAPSGALALLRIPEPERGEQGEPVVFEAPRSVIVRVRDERGDPVPQVTVQVGEEDKHLSLLQTGTTDAGGEAALAGLWPGRVTVFVATDTPIGGIRKPVGHVDLTGGNRDFDVELPRRRKVIIQVTVDGERRLPPSCLPLVIQGVRGPVTEDPENGRLVFDLWPDRDTRVVIVGLLARGYDAAEAAVRLADAGSATMLQMELNTLLPVVVAVKPPQDQSYDLALEGWSRHTRAWRRVSGGRLRRRGGHRFAFHMLQPGSYRPLDTLSGVRGERFRVGSRKDMPEIALDLETCGWVEGRVLLPETAEARAGTPKVSVQRRAGSAPGLVSVDEDGSFRVRTSAREPVHLRALHPYLVADPREGEVQVTGPQSGVRLRLVSGPTVAFDLEGPAPTDGLKVQLLRKRQVPGQGVFMRLAARSDGEYRLGGFEPGTFRLWVDAAPAAPLLRDGLSLTPGRNELGALQLAAGGRVRVTFVRDPQQSVPRLEVVALPLQSPHYQRRGASEDGEAVTITGLLPGRHRVTLHSAGGSLVPMSAQEVVEIEGEETVEVTFDIR